MYPCKIKIVEITVRKELAEKLHTDPVKPCPLHPVGREWTLHHYGRPLDFCENAWTAIHRMVYGVMSGVGSEIGGCWVEDGKRAIVSCNDGLRPVVFELTRIQSENSE